MIGAAAAAILADDATGVGVADDPLLIPLALAAMVGAIQSHAPTARDELSRAWLELGQQLEALRTTVARMTPRGNVVHQHLVDEARKRVIRRAAAEGRVLTESQVGDDLLCEELKRMEHELNKANKTRSGGRSFRPKRVSIADHRVTTGSSRWEIRRSKPC